MNISDVSSFFVPPIVTGESTPLVIELRKSGWKPPVGVGFIQADNVERVLVGGTSLDVRLLSISNFLLSQQAGRTLLQGASLSSLFDKSFCQLPPNDISADLLIFSLNFSLSSGLIRRMVLAEIKSSHASVDLEEVRRHLFLHYVNSRS